MVQKWANFVFLEITGIHKPIAFYRIKKMILKQFLCDQVYMSQNRAFPIKSLYGHTLYLILIKCCEQVKSGIVFEQPKKCFQRAKWILWTLEPLKLPY